MSAPSCLRVAPDGRRRQPPAEGAPEAIRDFAATTSSPSEISSMVARCLLAILPAIHAHVQGWTRIRAPRVIAAGCASSTLSDQKVELLKGIMYNKPLDERGSELFDLISDGAVVAPTDWWLGGFVMNTCNDFSRSLRRVCGPLLDGAPVTITADKDGGAMLIETDILVLGCATGLRIHGSICSGDGDSVRIVLNDASFFEPSEEFGITKALVKCEEKLRPVLPSAEEPLEATLEPLYVDEDMVLARASRLDGDDEHRLVFSRLSDAAMVTARARRG